VSVVRHELRSRTAWRADVAFRYELRDGRGNYIGTFVTEMEHWQIGDVFTTGDGCALRITAFVAPERSQDRPVYAGGWNVQPVEAQT
jgi:hypothetical protein